MSNPRAYIIAEAGVNHNGDPAMAARLVREAKRAGADAVKFQTFKAERVAQATAAKAAYQLRNTDPAESQIDMLRRLELPMQTHTELQQVCREEGLDFISTPYNEEDIDFLDAQGVSAIKLASIHLVEPHILRHAARTKRRIILSTGMSTLEQVGLAVRTLRSEKCEDFTLLQCTTNYPSAVSDANLLAMNTMRRAFECEVGYSDHTQSDVCCVAAVALGATMIEKHFTLDRNLPGPDHSSASEPEEFARLVQAIRAAESALGTGVKEPCAAEQGNITNMRRSLAARRQIVAGQVIQVEDITCRRPATGIAPALIDLVVGREAAVGIAAGAEIAWSMLK